MKYIIDIPDDTQKIIGFRQDYSLIYIDMTPYTEPDRSVIEDEVWEFAKKVRLEEFIDEEGRLHGYISGFNSYSEAKSKYEAWKKQKDEIRVGDEVIYDSRTKAVVVIPETEERYGTILTGDFATIVVSHDDLEKTGRHFDDIAELLKKMGDEK